MRNCLTLIAVQRTEFTHIHIHPITKVSPLAFVYRLCRLRSVLISMSIRLSLALVLSPSTAWLLWIACSCADSWWCIACIYVPIYNINLRAQPATHIYLARSVDTTGFRDRCFDAWTIHTNMRTQRHEENKIFIFPQHTTVRNAGSWFSLAVTPDRKDSVLCSSGCRSMVCMCECVREQRTNLISFSYLAHFLVHTITIKFINYIYTHTQRHRQLIQQLPGVRTNETKNETRKQRKTIRNDVWISRRIVFVVSKSIQNNYKQMIIYHIYQHKWLLRACVCVFFLQLINTVPARISQRANYISVRLNSLFMFKWRIEHMTSIEWGNRIIRFFFYLPNRETKVIQYY